MRNEDYLNPSPTPLGLRLPAMGLNLPRKTMIGIIMIVALLAFEIFNFDTTQYALRNLLGDVHFLSLRWASILAIAFCSIDFAGLIRLFTPERGMHESREVWYLMGAWLLGATMNAIMTWWAVSLTLLNHDFGNEVLNRGQLLRYVPIFVASLVWLTRILLIGSFSIAGDHIFEFGAVEPRKQARDAAAQGARIPMGAPQRARPATAGPVQPEQPTAVYPRPTAANTPSTPMPQRADNSRIRRRPPMPNGNTNNPRRAPGGIQAQARDRR